MIKDILLFLGNLYPYLKKYNTLIGLFLTYALFYKNIYLIFGKESTGIPKEILRNYLDRCIRIPCSDNVRCLNVANSVAIAVYEVMRQQDYPDLIRKEPFKGEDWLLED